MSPSRSMMTAGIVLIVGGVLALLAPYAVSIAITLIVGVSFLLGGLLNAWAALSFADGRSPTASSRCWACSWGSVSSPIRWVA
jgi:uncharacterized membrane protein HdeD (DUF308 family)